MAHTQDTRHIAITTPLGKDVLLLKGFNGQEGMSRLFSFNLDLLSEVNAAIDFDSIVGKKVTISIRHASAIRFINGIVRRFSQGEADPPFASYRAEVVPWLWLLTQTADCRIFQNMTVPDIIQQIFKDLGFTDFQLNLLGTFQPREYCVQYRETDFNFVSRLMEQYGIFYFFEHSDSKHVLVLGNTPSVHAASQPSKVQYQTTTGATVTPEAVVTSFTKEQEIRPSKFAMTDYNFETPRVRLSVNVESVFPAPTGVKFEVYDYPGEYTKHDDGEALVRLRMEEEEVQRVTVDGDSGCPQFAPGFKFDLTGHGRRDFDGSYVLLSVNHAGSEQGYVSGDGEGEHSYSNRFTCIPAAIPFRAPRTTPRPFIRGSQTAEVVGPKGEEIYTDKHGRVKVQFHWDREGKKDENSSLWIRVSHPWAGKGWGSVSIPRNGQEVIVDFLEGDPDQPIITGRVYNGEMMPPYGLPTGGMVSGLKSCTTPGGGGYNEMSMDDTKGQEKVTIHAQHDMGTNVEHDDHQSIKNNRAITIGQNDTTIVQKGNRETKIEKGDDTLTIAGGARVVQIKGGDKLTLLPGTGDREVTIMDGSDKLFVATGGIELTAPAGAYKLFANQVSITGMTEVNLICGASVINMKPALITITAPLVKINS